MVGRRVHSMQDTERLRRDLVALGIAALAVFIAVSLATYDPADPLVFALPPWNRFYQPDILCYPIHEHPRNACGYWGAMAAHVAFQALGLSAWYGWLALTVFAIRQLLRRPVSLLVVRLAGVVLTMTGLCAALAAVRGWWSSGPWVGPGGYWGLAVKTELERHFALTGSLIVSFSLIWGGLLLTWDRIAWQAFLELPRWGLKVLGAVLALFRRPSPEARRRTENAPSQARGPAVRVRGRSVAGAAIVEDELGDETVPAEASRIDHDPALRSEASGVVLHADSLQESPSADPSGVSQVGGPRIKRRSAGEREEVISSLDQAVSVGVPQDYQLPSLDLLLASDGVDYEAQAQEVRRNAKILEQTFLDFGYQVKVVEIETGPVIAQYEVQLEAGLRLSKITSLADDLAIALRVPSVRIVAPIPGKNTVGIEVPNSERQIVRLREVIEESGSRAAKMRIPLFLGKDVSGNPLVVDLSTLPHLLIAGRTGTGKSVCLNAIICSILMTRRPDEVRLLLIDPKMVELSCYGRLPHLMHPVVTDMRKAEAILAWAVEKMEERYALLARAGVRHISSYNQLSEEELLERLAPATDEERERIPRRLPFIVIIADEMADLMMTAGKEVEQHIIRLAQKSRAVGIHLILATQKPTVDVITGLIKSNLPARISFQVASRTDSRVVLDEMGADKLLGNGDMLFLWPGTSMLIRGQGTYVSDEEIERIVNTVSTGEQQFVDELMSIEIDTTEQNGPNRWKERDELYEQAIEVVVREQRGSVSLLQRALGIGYGRAARLIDFMQEDGIVGAYAGQHAREVLISMEDWRRMQANRQESDQPAPAAPPSAVHRIRRSSDGWNTPNEKAGDSEPHGDSDMPVVTQRLRRTDQSNAGRKVALPEDNEAQHPDDLLEPSEVDIDSPEEVREPDWPTTSKGRPKRKISPQRMDVSDDNRVVEESLKDEPDSGPPAREVPVRRSAR
ncbi:MAG: DNA translocase FtsK [Pirellulaceae bacterium]|nr:MAG: DNA translocase FtsK [Pirellulaceae bacterium]GIW94100.1 MAG: DNA translocase FtsK [Pirellulaceae bacterium]